MLLKRIILRIWKSGTIVGGQIYYIRYSNDPKQFCGDLLIVLKRLVLLRLQNKRTSLINLSPTMAVTHNIPDAYKGVDEGSSSDYPYAQSYRSSHRHGLKQFDESVVHNISRTLEK